MTYETLIHQVEYIRRTTTVPLLVDANTGFGDHDVVGYVVGLLEDRGADGICIEDKAYPRRNSFDPVGGGPLASPEAFAAKIRAAAAARRDPQFVVAARTEGLIAGEPLDRVLARAEMYRDAGADIIVVHSKSTIGDEILRFAEEWQRRAPLVIIPTTYPSISVAEAGKRGVSGVIWANQLLRATIPATERLLDELLAVDRLTECLTPAAPLEQLLDIAAEFSALAAAPSRRSDP